MLKPKACYQVTISAVSKKEAEKILDALTAKNLVAGGHITSGQSHYWWEGERVKKIYYTLSVYTTGRCRDNLIKDVRANHSDKTPVIAFLPIEDGIADFLDWIREFTA